MPIFATATESEVRRNPHSRHAARAITTGRGGFGEGFGGPQSAPEATTRAVRRRLLEQRADADLVARRDSRTPAGLQRDQGVKAGAGQNKFRVRGGLGDARRGQPEGVCRGWCTIVTLTKLSEASALRWYSAQGAESCPEIRVGNEATQRRQDPKSKPLFIQKIRRPSA